MGAIFLFCEIEKVLIDFIDSNDLGRNVGVFR